MKIKSDGSVEFEKIPTVISVRRNLSKGRHQYFSFIPREGATYIREYLEERISSIHQKAYDAEHVRNAMTRFNQVDPNVCNPRESKRRILEAAKKFGIDVRRD